ncbi:MAG: hypothetical protein AAF721_42200 [Myxococcota bacterium]
MVLPSCDLLGGPPDEDLGKPKPPPPGEGSGDAGSGGQAGGMAEPLTRAKKRLRFIGKASEHLGWKLTALAKMYSLAGPMEVPQWSAPGDGDARLTRDDDLRTAWTCEHQKGSECAIGIHFPQPATVVAVRLNASPSGADEPGKFGRVKVLRIHTDEGWAEDRVEPMYEDLYLQLGEPVTTRNLTIEVIETQTRSANLLRFAEVDVYGTSGDARDAMEIAPESIYLRTASPAWKKTTSGDRALEPPRLEYALGAETPKTLALGSAVYASGERMLLIEDLQQTKCKSHLGNYVMLDRKTRVRTPLGDMGGMPADVWLHGEGNGFAVGYVDEDRTRVHGFVLNEGVYQRKKSSRASRDTYHELFKQWGIDEVPAPRGGGTIDEPPAGCETATDEDFARLQAARPAAGDAPEKKNKKKRKKKRRGKALAGPADRWLVCALTEEADVFVSTGESCGSRFEIAVVDKAGTQVARQGDNRKGAHVRVRKAGANDVLVEVAGNDDATETWHVTPTAIKSLGMGTALAVSPPASCRERCDSPFTNARSR